MRTTKYKIAKFITYGTAAALLCVLQNTPGLFVLFGVKPMLVFSFSICAAIFERETAGGLFGLFGGLLCDIFSSYTFGFYALLLFLCCVLAGLVTQGYVRPVAINAMLLTFFGILFAQGSGFFFTIFIRGVPDSMRYFTGHLLPMCAYTAATALLFFFPTRAIHLYWQRKIDAA